MTWRRWEVREVAQQDGRKGEVMESYALDWVLLGVEAEFPVG